ncbi:MAG TPA: Wzz/FepE/Etk N-terminal domain-containing protein, partial [Pilimelia sp.]|nr:Wzz/FepE/Etk N-terminal domain-containing protein [Pilimelia sp.]
MSTNFSDYFGMLRRHWWVVLLLTAGAVGAADAVTRAMPQVYESATSVLVQPAGQDTNVVGGRTKGDINLDTEAQLVGSNEVAAGAAALLRSAAPPGTLAANVLVEVPPNTSVLVITYAAPTPREAQAGSHSFAEAYLRNREASARAVLNEQITALSTKVKQLNEALVKVNNRLAAVSDESSERPNLESQRTTSINQINNLSGKLNQLTTATVSAGKIISDAPLPIAPSKPDRTLNLASGAMVGLLTGLAVAALRERLDRRVRRAIDVERRAGVAVLAELNPRTAPRFDDVLPPYGPGGRVFNRLRNEVLAGLEPGAKLLVVTGASQGPTSTLVAANLAAALARTGNEVVLVGAHLPETVVDAAPLARILGVSATPGLSDLLAGRVSIADAAQRAARIPYLRVITTGGTATAAGLMQSQALRETLVTLRGQADYVVIEAPSTATSADAQSLASLADAAIITVELRRTRRPQVVDAAEQLRRVSTPLLGAVVMPRLTTKRSRPPLPVPGRPAIPVADGRADGVRPGDGGRPAGGSAAGNLGGGTPGGARGGANG